MSLGVRGMRLGHVLRVPLEIIREELDGYRALNARQANTVWVEPLPAHSVRVLQRAPICQIVEAMPVAHAPRVSLVPTARSRIRQPVGGVLLEHMPNPKAHRPALRVRAVTLAILWMVVAEV